VLDTSGAGQFVGLGPAAPIVSNYGDHPITQEFAEGRSFFPLARPVESRELPDIVSTPLLLTNPQSQAEAVSDDGNLAFDPDAPPEGPYVLGVALSRPADDRPTEPADPTEETDPVDEETSEADDDANNETAEPETLSDGETADAEVTEEEADSPNSADAADEADEVDETNVAAVEDEADEVDEIDEIDEADVTDEALEDTPDGPETTDAADSADADRADREARLVVIGNSTFASDGAFDQQLNGDIFLNAVNWLAQAADATLSIRPKTVVDRRIAMTGQQAWGLGIFSLLVLPLTGLALAIVMAFRRR
jgi:ABC-type uncharacterized transport system involved in gliding motility auxiliary subunit